MLRHDTCWRPAVWLVSTSVTTLRSVWGSLLTDKRGNRGTGSGHPRPFAGSAQSRIQVLF